MATASYDAATSVLVTGDFLFLEIGLANEQQVNVISVDTVVFRGDPSSLIKTPVLDGAPRRKQPLSSLLVRVHPGQECPGWP